MKADNIRNFLFCRLVRSKLKEDLEDYNYRRLAAAAERLESLKKCRGKLLLYHPEGNEE